MMFIAMLEKHTWKMSIIYDLKDTDRLVHGGGMFRIIMAGEIFDGFRVVGFDLETTGFDVRKERIVEYALIGSDVDGSDINLQSLVYPEKRIPFDASNVHGIKDQDVRGAGNFSEHIGEISKIINDSIIVGHNIIKFDWKMLEIECFRAGVETPKPRAIIDTLVIARKLKIPGRHKLGILCNKYGIDLSNAHRADADAGATLILLWKIMKEYPRFFRGSIDDLQDNLAGGRRENLLGPGLEDLEPVPQSRGLLRINNTEIIVAFGKHKGRSLDEINRNDPRYLNWLFSPSSPIERSVCEKYKHFFQS
jgi:DNA polymerase-3 subunit epsilon